MANQTSAFFDLVQKRQSVRRFTEATVEREKLIQCVKAAHLAPSAENSQPWQYIFVDNKELKKKLARRAFSGVFRATRWAQNAPVLVVLCAKLDIVANRIGKHISGIPYYLLDMGISGEHFVLQAQELGLGSCWIGWFSARGAKRALNLPRLWRPVAMLAVGYSAHQRIRQKKRRDVEEIYEFNGVPG